MLAEDALGNRVESAFLDRFFPKPLKTSQINLQDDFLEKVVGEIAARTPEIAAGDDVLATYKSTTDPLSDTERSALPLLGVALRLDALADVLTDWAVSGPLDPPTDEVDHSCAEVLNELDRLGVPVEQGPSRGRDRRNRGL